MRSQIGDSQRLLVVPLQMLDGTRDTLGVTALTVRGATTNLRRRVRAGGFLLEVDETRFPDGSVDAEVEVETDDPEGARAVVEAAAAEAGVALAVQTLGKYARFLERS